MGATSITHMCVIVLLCGVIIAANAQRSIQLPRSLILSGGGENDNTTDIWNSVIDLAGGRDQARLCVITAAHDNPPKSFATWSGIFRPLGPASISWVPVDVDHKGNNSDPRIVSLVQSCTGWWFGGGDQQRIVDSFYFAGHVASPVMAALLKQWNEFGGIIGGSSAGCAVQTAHIMIDGGDTYTALIDGSFDQIAPHTDDDLVYNPDGGILTFVWGYVDTHVGARGRQGRMARLLADTSRLPRGGIRSYSVDEDAALLVTNIGLPSQSTLVLGNNGVSVIDITDATWGKDGASRWFIRNVKLHYATAGDSLDLASGNITFAPWKVSLLNREHRAAPLTSNDIFNSHSHTPYANFVQISSSLVDARGATSTWGRTYETSPSYRVDFHRNTASDGADGVQPITADYKISIRALYYDIVVG